MENINIDLGSISDLAVKYGLKLLLALITLVIGLWIIKMIMNAIGQKYGKKRCGCYSKAIS